MHQQNHRLHLLHRQDYPQHAAHDGPRSCQLKELTKKWGVMLKHIVYGLDMTLEQAVRSVCVSVCV